MIAPPAEHPAAPGDPDRIDTLVLAEQVRALFDRNVVAQATVVLNSLVVVLVLWSHSSPARLLPWLGAVWAVAAARFALGRSYRCSEPAPEDAARWGRRFTLGAALNGIGWGAAALLLPSGAPPADGIFVAFVVAGMAAGGALSNASHQPAFVAFTAPAIVPLAASFVAAGGRLQLAMALMLAVFAGAVTAISRSGGKALITATRLRFQNAELASRLAASAADLERRVLERTAQLEAAVSREREAEQQLVSSIRLAGLGSLAAVVAHEVNSPLAYVGSNLTFVREELGREEADPELQATMRTALDDAAVGLARVKSIVRHLNDASRVELRAGLERVDLHAALDLALAIAARDVRGRATVVREYGAVPPVTAGHVHLVQVFLNLLLNATESIPEGRPADHRVRITTRPHPSTGQVVVEVSDSGCGISPGDLERIWEPFFTTKPPGRGSGLGLSICRDILARFGGRVTATSAAGVGSTFTVWLNAAPAETSARAG